MDGKYCIMIIISVVMRNFCLYPYTNPLKTLSFLILCKLILWNTNQKPVDQLCDQKRTVCIAFSNQQHNYHIRCACLSLTSNIWMTSPKTISLHNALKESKFNDPTSVRRFIFDYLIIFCWTVGVCMQRKEEMSVLLEGINI